MESNGIEQAYRHLIEVSAKRGYILFDDISDDADKYSLTIQEIDYLSNTLVSRGIIIYDSQPDTDDYKDCENVDDYAQCDYDEIFDRVIKLDPILKPLIEKIRKIKPPQTHELEQLKYLIHEGNEHARKQMIEMHLRFAVRLSLQRYEVFNCEIADTLQDACIGLICAVDKYDPDTNGVFGSYASLWILQNISRNQPTQMPTGYYTAHKKEDYFTIYPLLNNQYFLKEKQLSSSESIIQFIQNRLDCDRKSAIETFNACLPEESLDELWNLSLKNISKTDDFNENEFYKDIQALFISKSSVENDVFNFFYHKEILSVLAQLKEKDQKVIRWRFGLDDDDERTLEDIGKELNVTRERIRQIEVATLKKLRPMCISKELQFFIA